MVKPVASLVATEMSVTISVTMDRRALMFRMSLFEFLAAPGHLWIWVCAKLCGGTLEFGPIEDVEDDGER